MSIKSCCPTKKLLASSLGQLFAYKDTKEVMSENLMYNGQSQQIMYTWT